MTMLKDALPGCQAVPSRTKLWQAVLCMAAHAHCYKVPGDSGEQHLRSGDANLRPQAGHGWDVVDSGHSLGFTVQLSSLRAAQVLVDDSAESSPTPTAVRHQI